MRMSEPPDVTRMSCVCKTVHGDGSSKIISACSLHQAYARDEVEAALTRERTKGTVPIPMLLWCPGCGERHIDEGEFATRVHTTHACQACGFVWRPAIVATIGMKFLPGFKNEETR